MAFRKLRGARTVVTGASSGIGQAFSRELARHGARQIVTARREDRLKELVDEIRGQGGEAFAVPGDVTDPAVRTAVLEAAREHLGGLDLLINNAGVGAIGPFCEAGPERLRRIMEVNFFAPAELIRQAVPLLRQGNRPMIVNIASVLGQVAVPKKSEYCASKFALHGLNDSLRCELRGDGIDVLLICPTTTKSEFFDVVLEKNAELPWLKFGGMTSRSVARRSMHAIRWGRREVVMSVMGKILVYLDRWVPFFMSPLIARFG